MSDKTGRYYGLVPDFTPREVDMPYGKPRGAINWESECRKAQERITELESKLEQAEADYKALQIETSEICSELTAENKRLKALVKNFEPVPQGHTDEGDAMLSALAQLEQALQGERGK